MTLFSWKKILPLAGISLVAFLVVRKKRLEREMQPIDELDEDLICPFCGVPYQEPVTTVGPGGKIRLERVICCEDMRQLVQQIKL